MLLASPSLQELKHFAGFMILGLLVAGIGALCHSAYAHFREHTTPDLDEDHYDFRETSVRLSLNDHELRELVARGELSASPHGSSLKFPRDEVDSLVPSRVPTPPAEAPQAPTPRVVLAASERVAAPAAPAAPASPASPLKVTASGSSKEHCPFCRDRISTLAQVACVSCLARHHEACWDEHGRCSTCDSHQRFASVETTSARTNQVPDRVDT